VASAPIAAGADIAQRWRRGRRILHSQSRRAICEPAAARRDRTVGTSSSGDAVNRFQLLDIVEVDTFVVVAAVT
jgi:hypothetical protein